jgi:hypothetical protein
MIAPSKCSTAAGRPDDQVFQAACKSVADKIRN